MHTIYDSIAFLYIHSKQKLSDYSKLLKYSETFPKHIIVGLPCGQLKAPSISPKLSSSPLIYPSSN